MDEYKKPPGFRLYLLTTAIHLPITNGFVWSLQFNHWRQSILWLVICIFTWTGIFSVLTFFTEMRCLKRKADYLNREIAERRTDINAMRIQGGLRPLTAAEFERIENGDFSEIN